MVSLQPKKNSLTTSFLPAKWLELMEKLIHLFQWPSENELALLDNSSAAYSILELNNPSSKHQGDMVLTDPVYMNKHVYLFFV